MKYQATLTTKAKILEALRTGGEEFATWLATLNEETLGERVYFPEGAQPPSKTRFEMLLSPKEHEMHHRAQTDGGGANAGDGSPPDQGAAGPNAAVEQRPASAKSGLDHLILRTGSLRTDCRTRWPEQTLEVGRWPRKAAGC